MKTRVDLCASSTVDSAFGLGSLALVLGSPLSTNKERRWEGRKEGGRKSDREVSPHGVVSCRAMFETINQPTHR